MGQELVLVHLALGTTYRLNATAKLIFLLAVDGHSAPEIAERLHRSLGVPAEQLERDATTVLVELAGLSLVETVP